MRITDARPVPMATSEKMKVTSPSTALVTIGGVTLEGSAAGCFLGGDIYRYGANLKMTARMAGPIKIAGTTGSNA